MEIFKKCEAKKRCNNAADDVDTIGKSKTTKSDEKCLTL